MDLFNLKFLNWIFDNTKSRMSHMNVSEMFKVFATFKNFVIYFLNTKQRIYKIRLS